MKFAAFAEPAEYGEYGGEPTVAVAATLAAKQMPRKDKSLRIWES
jgi:hypothetical protein